MLASLYLNSLDDFSLSLSDSWRLGRRGYFKWSREREREGGGLLRAPLSAFITEERVTEEILG